MRTLKILTAVILTLLILTPPALGFFAERQIRRLLSENESALAASAPVRFSDYQRGYLKSTAVLHLRLNGLDKTLQAEIYHAPFINTGTKLIRAKSDNDTAVQLFMDIGFTGKLEASAALPFTGSGFSTPKLHVTFTVPVTGGYPQEITAQAASASLQNQAEIRDVHADAVLSEENRTLHVTAASLTAGQITYNNINFRAALTPLAPLLYSLSQELTADMHDPNYPDYRQISLTGALSPINPDRLQNTLQAAAQIAQSDVKAGAIFTAKTAAGETALTAELDLKENIKSPLQFALIKQPADILPYLTGSSLTITQTLPPPAKTDRYTIESGQLLLNGAPQPLP